MSSQVETPPPPRVEPETKEASMPRLNSIVPLVGSLLLSRGGRRLAGRHAGKLALATLALEVWRNRRQKAGQTQDQTTSEPRPRPRSRWSGRSPR
jgi:hypothetical protein